MSIPKLCTIVPILILLAGCSNSNNEPPKIQKPKWAVGEDGSPERMVAVMAYSLEGHGKSLQWMSKFFDADKRGEVIEDKGGPFSVMTMFYVNDELYNEKTAIEKEYLIIIDPPYGYIRPKSEYKPKENIKHEKKTDITV